MRTILIADDEPYVARVMRLVLENEGYHVVCADDGQQALDAFIEIEPDVLIADIKMPLLDGRELVDRIRRLETGANIPVIVMTSSLESCHQQWLAQMGNIRFAGKPVSPRELVTIINAFFADTEKQLKRAASI